ncbi:cAMP-dependent protein kinase regulatory subunit [Lachancea thermotolerans]|uniref:cAMP-dependent protein kinase regulatory subunit n=1 Tax=Lachancea thermotolerans (strain ATCC 56472 / CBS 6340 / NRRL Y-8284) TaxID=559295 RepID=C5DBK8_LACTC|nr:KLTH0A03432p [Lachancea thermotolerans CBS 6340]CAR21165.1 KLTH0A03432p [Lachancea thermotolerans CBS 6340]
MPLSSNQMEELNLFQRKVHEDQPKDLLQFAANYFNRRLEQQRFFARNQESLALSKGIVLFPSATRNDSVVASGSLGGRIGGLGSLGGTDDQDVLFKAPFAEQDPHAHDPHATHENSQDGDQQNDSDAGGLFKNNFRVNQSSDKDIKKPVDPMAPDHTKSPSPQPTKIPRRSTLAPQPLPLNFNAQRRTSVSAETMTPDNLDDWTPENFNEKTGEQLARLEKAIGRNFLFNKLDSESKRLVINSLEEKTVKQSQEIIKQGDEGDYFYIVEKGTVDFYVGNEKVNTSGPGSSFGELALMYNSPRAATVVANTDCVLWALDRLTFRRILLGGSFKKRILYDEFLKSMPVLQSLSTYDRAKLADALDTELYHPGQVIIREGDNGENFYFIEYGEAEVSKEGQGIIAHLKQGDYFGEVALLNDLPRQATVKAIKKTKVATLGKSGFQRLLGPAVEVLKLNDPTRVDH